MPRTFPYTQQLLAALHPAPESVSQVLEVMQTLEETMAEGDGLRWFNWLYLRVTSAVRARVESGGFSDPGWMAQLDVQFARLYFQALKALLSGEPSPGCWRALFDRRGDSAVARIQFALAGINAHINRDLPVALAATCGLSGEAPLHGSARYADYTALNSTLDAQVAASKQELMVRLLGDPLPSISRLEDTLAAWSVAAAREAAWTNAELLWNLRGLPGLSSRYLQTLDGLTALAGKTLIAPIPVAPSLFGASGGTL